MATSLSSPKQVVRQPIWANGPGRAVRGILFGDVFVAASYLAKCNSGEAGGIFSDVPNNLGETSREVARAHTGEPTRATVEVDAVTKGAAVKGDMLFAGARVYSLAAGAARRDERLARAERDQRADRYAARAVELLAKARGTGFFEEPANLDQLKNDRDFEPLRARADFQQVLAELEKPKAGGE